MSVDSFLNLTPEQIAFLQDWGALILAGIALLLWLMTFLSGSLFRPRAALEIIPQGVIEIGFGSNGPTLALTGTVLGAGAGQFIDGMTVEVRRDGEPEAAVLDWGMSRDRMVVETDEGGEERCVMRLPVGISLRPSEARAFDIVFWREPLRSEIGQELDRVAEAWEGYMLNNQDPPGPSDPVQNSFNRFVTSNEVVARAYNRFDQSFLWQPASYSIALRISRAGAKPIMREWHFAIDEADSKLLHQNIMRAITEASRGHAARPAIVYRSALGGDA